MKFVAMQPKKNVDRECIALPDVGPSVIVLDAADAELRDMNWDIRILRGKGPNGDADPEADIVGRLPVQKFRNGMVNFDQNFKEPGAYVLYAKLTSDDGAKSFIGKHPFSVGLVTEEEIYLYIAFAVFVAAAGGVAFTSGARASSDSKFRIFRRRIEPFPGVPLPPPRFAQERGQIARVMKIPESCT